MAPLFCQDSVNRILLTLGDKVLHFRKIKDGIHLPANGEINRRHRVLNPGQFSFGCLGIEDDFAVEVVLKIGKLLSFIGFPHINSVQR